MERSTAFRRTRLVLTAAALTLVLVQPGFAQDLKAQGFARADRLLTELLALAVVVTLLESAMATLFQWRVYRMLFNARAVKTVFMVLAGWGVVSIFDYDVFSRILALAGVGVGQVSAETIKVQSGVFSLAMSSFVLAGGSAGIHTLMRRFGFRSPLQDEAAAPPLREDEAWVSITIRRARAVGAVKVHLDEVTTTQAEGAALLGVVEDRWAISRVFEMFFATPGRVPSYGGRKVKVGQSYRIVATGLRRVAGAVPGAGGDDALEAFSEEIYHGRFASRAVIDLVAII